MTGRARTMPELLGRLGRDERGSVLVFFALSIGVMFAFAALIYDLGRLASTATDLQSFADHMALTAAGELDGQPDAFTRAQTAANNLISDTQSFATGGRTLTGADVTLRFLWDLPLSDTAPITAAFETTSAAAAAFVEVTVNPRTVNYLFIGLVNAMFGTAAAEATTIQARAVAGFTRFVCDISPLMFCVPPGELVDGRYTPVPGRMIWLKAQGSGWAPGAFGLLDVNWDPTGPCGPPSNGANYFRCATGVANNITQCFVDRGTVSIRPGELTGPAESGFNTRFDIYTTSLNSVKNNPAFVPAPNVVKGIGPNGGGGCLNNSSNYQEYKSSPPAPQDSAPLPRDTCFGTNSCGGNGRFGNGNWNKPNYLNTNHGGANIAGTTRYEVYKNELAAAGTGRILPPAKTETGRPTCSSGMSSDPERRVLIAAAIDCTQLSPPRVAAFVRLFMTQPSGTPNEDAGETKGSANGNLWVEEIEEVEAAGGGPGFKAAHEIVQLFR